MFDTKMGQSAHSMLKKRSRSNSSTSDTSTTTCTSNSHLDKKFRPNQPNFEERRRRYVTLCHQRSQMHLEYSYATSQLDALIEKLDILSAHALGSRSLEDFTHACVQISEHKKRKASNECEFKIKFFGLNTCLAELDFGAYDEDRASDCWTTESWVEYEARHKPMCKPLSEPCSYIS